MNLRLIVVSCPGYYEKFAWFVVMMMMIMIQNEYV